MDKKEFTVSEVIDSIGISSHTWIIFVILAFAMIFDGYDFMIVNSTNLFVAHTFWPDNPNPGTLMGSLTTWGLLGMVLGGAVGGIMSDKIGRKKLFLIGTIGTAIFGLCLAMWANESNVLVLMLLYGVCYGMPTGIHATFIGECFPTHLRTTGVGFTFNIGRLGAFIAPILIGKMVDMDMISLGIATMTVSYVLCSVATLPIKEREYDASKVSAELE